MIVGLCGWMGSGKDTVADYLVTAHDFRRDSFAAALKDAIAVIFGWDREMLEGRTEEARAQREVVDRWWANRLGIPHLTPRWVLQHWGTEVCRTGFHNDIWIASLENRLRNSAKNTVISDCRFPNEIEAIKSQGGKIIWVRRGTLPDWYNLAVDANNGSVEAKEALENLKVHSSETSWVGRNFDIEIGNNGTLDMLYEATARSLRLSLQVSTQDDFPLTQSDS